MHRGCTARALAPVGLALLLVAGIAGPAFACDPARSDRRDTRTYDDGGAPVDEVSVSTDVAGFDAGPTSAAARGSSAIAPGSVNRTSAYLSATVSRQPVAEIRVAGVPGEHGRDHHQHVGRPDRPRRAQHDRGAARRHVDSTPSRSTARRVAAGSATRRSSCRWAASWPPETPSRSASITWRRCAARLAGSNWLFTRANGIVDAYRWIPWVSRATPFTRPNHGDPFVTPVSPEVIVNVTTDRRLVIASTADRRIPVEQRAHPALRRAQRARRDDHRGTRLPHRDRHGRVDEGPLLLPVVGQPRARSSTPRPTRSAPCSPGSGRTPTRSTRSSSRPAATAWSHPA